MHSLSRVQIKLAINPLWITMIASLICSSFGWSDPIGQNRRPNIILILADDLGWSDIGCYGGEIHTPHLDKLASAGIRFTQFHNTAKCFPSRASLLTGLYAQQCGMNDKPAHFQNSVTLAELLRKAGYRTLMTGKHHGLDHPMDLGFDRYYGLRDGACNYFNPGLQRDGEDPPAKKRAKFQPRTWCIDRQILEPYTPQEDDFYTTDYFTNYALKYLQEYQDEIKPFFLYLAYTAPHDPLQAWPKDITKYQGKYMDGFEVIRQARYNRQKAMGLVDESFPLSVSTYQKWEDLTAQEKNHEDHIMSVYAAMIDRMDQNIGRIVDKVQQMGELDHTLILFASDNGCAPGGTSNPGGYSGGATTRGEIGSMARWTKISKSWSNVSNTPFRLHKVQAHKGGTCTPLIAFWPDGIKGKNQISHEVGHFIDIMPTLIDVAGMEYPTDYPVRDISPLQGRSLVPIFRQEDVVHHDPLFWQYGKGKAVRKGPWRLVSDNFNPWALYDMRSDKTETTNLIEKYPKVAGELVDLYQDWMHSAYNYHAIGDK